jgi:hypothetical protein
LADIASLITAVVALGALVAGYVQFVLRRWLLPSVEFDVDFTGFSGEPAYVIGEVACIIKNTGSNMLLVTGVRCRMSYRCVGEGRYLQKAAPDAWRPKTKGRHEREPIEPLFEHAVEHSSSKSHWLLILPPRSCDSTGSVSTPYISAMSTTESAEGSSSPSDNQAASAPVSGISLGGAASAQSLSEGGAPPRSSSVNKSCDDRTFVQPGATQIYRKPIVLPAEAHLLHVWGAFDYRIEMSQASKRLVGIFNKPPPNLDWRNGVTNHTVRRTFKVTATAEDRK